MRLPAAIVLLALLPLAVLAAEEPEAVYAKFHHAAASGDLEEMARHGPDARRAELATMSAAQKEATLKMVSMMLPRAFTLRQKQVNPNGQSARLVVSGPSGERVDGKPEILYGSIRMAMLRGEWKVEESEWRTEPPAMLSTARPAPAPAAAKAAPKSQAAPAAPKAQPEPPKVLGTARPPCVYKAVMTAEDVENCR